ncbi:hypothetical protein HPB49_022416 [Dermacentor silvarum]|uniref:Uncharacterized protein n=1 Tax=Dermacentor silvarum TaxID=543639 RepID=A0ACB8CBL1_DERSI|nr:hypothetical protein HPB49_022416 [Dermacentor silvarum]
MDLTLPALLDLAAAPQGSPPCPHSEQGSQDLRLASLAHFPEILVLPLLVVLDLLDLALDLWDDLAHHSLLAVSRAEASMVRQALQVTVLSVDLVLPLPVVHSVASQALESSPAAALVGPDPLNRLYEEVQALAQEAPAALAYADPGPVPNIGAAGAGTVGVGGGVTGLGGPGSASGALPGGGLGSGLNIAGPIGSASEGHPNLGAPVAPGSGFPGGVPSVPSGFPSSSGSSYSGSSGSFGSSIESVGGPGSSGSFGFGPIAGGNFGGQQDLGFYSGSSRFWQKPSQFWILWSVCTSEWKLGSKKRWPPWRTLDPVPLRRWTSALEALELEYPALESPEAAYAARQDLPVYGSGYDTGYGNFGGFGGPSGFYAFPSNGYFGVQPGYGFGFRPSRFGSNRGSAGSSRAAGASGNTGSRSSRV